MCGRYYFNLDDSPMTINLIQKIQDAHLDSFKLGEIFPCDNVLCLIIEDNQLKMTVKKWGIEKESLLINARLETINSKPTFKNLKRCVVIANAFYEWNDKTKFFIKTNDNYIYLACLYDSLNDLVIITKEADETMNLIHDRMPIIMNKQEMLDYLGLKDINVSKKELIIEKAEQTKIIK